jgi:hypothetical protein
MPLCPTVAAIAAPIPTGANAITIATNLNMTSLKLSQNPSMIFFGAAGVCARATAKRIDQNTTWSTSLFEAACTKLAGTTCSRMPENVIERCEASVMLDAT